MSSGSPGCPGGVGNEIPSDFELKVRFTHAPEIASDGRSADRAWRTRASASVARSVASSTGVAWPDATRTASAKERRSGVGVAGCCAPRKEGAATSHAITAPSRRLLLSDAMEVQVDVGVEVLLHVEGLRHARRERAARHRGVYQRRHRDRKSTRLNSSHSQISYAVFCLKKKKNGRSIHTSSPLGTLLRTSR